MKRKSMMQQDDKCDKWKLWGAKLGVVYQALRIALLCYWSGWPG